MDRRGVQLARPMKHAWVGVAVLAAGTGGAATPPGDAAPFARASICSPFGCSWSVQVSSDGVVRVINPSRPHRGGTYTLGRRQMVRLRETLERERALELSGDIGPMHIDAPVRTIELVDGSRRARVRVHSMPSGSGIIYKTDPSTLGRALRVCEALRVLVRDPDVASCVRE
jgi:hypothetical protein